MFVVAAGEPTGGLFGSDNADDFAPATFGNEYVNVITVGATTTGATNEAADSRSSVSNYGDAVNIAAPGELIYSPAPRGKGQFSADNNYDEQFSGTSASAPIVAGVAGLIKSIKPSLMPGEIKQILIESAVPITTTDTAEQSKTLGTGCIKPGDTPPNGFRGCRLNALAAICHPFVLNCQ